MKDLELITKALNKAPWLTDVLKIKTKKELVAISEAFKGLDINIAKNHTYNYRTSEFTPNNKFDCVSLTRGDNHASYIANLPKQPILKNKYTKIDIRTKEEVINNMRTNQKDYLHIEMKELLTNYKKYLELDKGYIVYCQSGRRAEETMKRLEVLGYQVMNGGGIN